LLVINPSRPIIAKIATLRNGARSVFDQDDAEPNLALRVIGLLVVADALGMISLSIGVIGFAWSSSRSMRRPRRSGSPRATRSGGVIEARRSASQTNANLPPAIPRRTVAMVV
jgi:hypothetical protein